MRSPIESRVLALSLALWASCAARPTAAREEQLTGAGPAHVLIAIAPGPDVATGFWIGKFEVTQAQFAAFVHATGYDGSDHPSSKASEPFLADWRDRRPPEGQDQHPACYLNLHHARAYCAWLSRATGRKVRLPTDAEWQLAAAGPTRRIYPWGDVWDPRCCNLGGAGDGFDRSSPVGSFPAGITQEGGFDFAGNIWEWTEEGHLRGGPWCMGQDSVRCAEVADEDDDRADDKFGLRIVVEW